MISERGNRPAPANPPDVPTRGDTKPELILLIHGTGAWRQADEGDAWWQLGSDHSVNLLRCLGPGFRLPAPGELFKWREGENSERRRRQAGLELASRIRELERAQQPYHLVGHSHGGSVLWDALRWAALDHWLAGGDSANPALPYLRSCVTVGTPFLRFRGPPPPRTPLLRGLITWSSPGLILVLLIAAGLVALLQQGLPIPWYLALGVGLGAIIALGGLLRRGVGYAEGATIDLEKAAGEVASLLFGERWLALWSPDDEAINALDKSRTFPAKEPIAPRLHLSDPAFFPVDLLSTLARPLLVPFYWLYNRLVAPRADGFIWAALQRRAQGNDRAEAHIEAVDPAPSDWLNGVPHLPNDVVAALSASADQAAQQVLPHLRRLLGERDLTGEAILLGAPLQDVGIWRSLVHTSYFDSDAVRYLICRHLASPAAKVSNLEADPALEAWYGYFRTWAQKQVSGQDPARILRKAIQGALARYWLGEHLAAALAPALEGYLRKAYLRVRERAAGRDP